METKFLINRNLSIQGYDFAFIQRDKITGKVFLGEIVFKEIDPTEVLQSTPVSKDAVQAIMDDLWSMGIRPTNSADNKNIIQAKDNHISDLRAIAFKGLKINQNVE